MRLVSSRSDHVEQGERRDLGVGLLRGLQRGVVGLQLHGGVAVVELAERERGLAVGEADIGVRTVQVVQQGLLAPEARNALAQAVEGGVGQVGGGDQAPAHARVAQVHAGGAQVHDGEIELVEHRGQVVERGIGGLRDALAHHHHLLLRIAGEGVARAGRGGGIEADGGRQAGRAGEQVAPLLVARVRERQHAVAQRLERSRDGVHIGAAVGAVGGEQQQVLQLQHVVADAVQDGFALALARHATSKIRHAEDLFALHTKGFRGEALASIAAIAHVELKTRQEQDELGTHLVIEGSKFTSQDVAVLPRGTSFAVKNLFFNIPARRNFLKSDTVEFRHVIDEFERVAMAHHNISFILYHNGSEMFNLPSGNQRQRIVNIFGGRTNEKLVPVKESTEIVQITGFVTKPEFAKKNKGEQFFFVNDRFIKDAYLNHAVNKAYQELLPDDNFPLYVLFIEIDPAKIDVNVHPTKTEIKYLDELEQSVDQNKNKVYGDA